MLIIPSLDSSILLWINGHHTPFWDQFMWVVSQPLTWVPLYVVMCVVLWRQGRTANRSTTDWYHLLFSVLCIILAFGLSDFVTASVIKPLVARPRPSHSELEPLLHFVRGYQGGAFGFPSSHAANCWAVCMSFLLLMRESRHYHLWSCILVSYALINCYSRMYLGVHYPSDILVGALIGLAFGYLSYLLFKKVSTLFY